MNRLRTAAAAALVAATALAGLTACSSDDPDYVRVCERASDHVRVDGADCGSSQTSSDGFLWWYLVYGRSLPAYGAPVRGGYRVVRSTSIVEHDESLAPRGGTGYRSSTTTRTYSTGSGKRIGTYSGSSGFRTGYSGTRSTGGFGGFRSSGGGFRSSGFSAGGRG